MLKIEQEELDKLIKEQSVLLNEEEKLQHISEAYPQVLHQETQQSFELDSETILPGSNKNNADELLEDMD